MAASQEGSSKEGIVLMHAKHDSIENHAFWGVPTTIDDRDPPHE